MQERVLIVGAGGQVGTALAQYQMQTHGPGSLLQSARAARADWLQLDLATLRDQAEAANLLHNRRITSILCVGAFTYVDGCEDNPELAFQVNAHAPAALAAYARRQNIPFVYFSTDYLFDGTDESPGPYLEDSQPHPINIYGASKLAGERAVLDAHPEALILRTAGVYGPDQQKKNYLYTVLRALVTGQTLRIPQDQVSTPTYNADLAAATFDLLHQNAIGVFHVCGPQRMNRLELAQNIAGEFSLDPAPLHGVLTRDLGQRAARPLHAGLQIAKLQQHLTPTCMQTLNQALSGCKPQMQEQVKAWCTSAHTL